uniref:Uncharacterized protein n=1 Tax=Macrostomum lignano TaxID=282301 RepID=A0A1I8FDV0_9PLAT
MRHSLHAQAQRTERKRGGPYETVDNLFGFRNIRCVPMATARPISAQLPMELHQLRSPGNLRLDTLDRVCEQDESRMPPSKTCMTIVSQTLETRPADQSDQTSRPDSSVSDPWSCSSSSQQQQPAKRPLSS